MFGADTIAAAYYTPADPAVVVTPDTIADGEHFDPTDTAQAVARAIHHFQVTSERVGNDTVGMRMLQQAITDDLGENGLTLDDIDEQTGIWTATEFTDEHDLEQATDYLAARLGR